MSDVRCQKSDVRCQMSDVRDQTSEVRSQKSENINKSTDIQSSALATRMILISEL
jgi:hypothetical protein